MRVVSRPNATRGESRNHLKNYDAKTACCRNRREKAQLGGAENVGQKREKMGQTAVRAVNRLRATAFENKDNSAGTPRAEKPFL